MLLDLLFPKRCLACRKFLSKSDFLCKSCEQAWPNVREPRCIRCLLPFQDGPSLNHLCGDCLKEEYACSLVHATGFYRGILHDMILRLKYRGEERLASYLGQRMAGSFLEHLRSFDLLVPVPLHKDRLRERGFNQACLLARAVGKKLKIPMNPFLMEKKMPTLPQVMLKGEERRQNLKGVFILKDKAAIQGKKIMLVDDVYTTGTTVEALAKCLVRSGAGHVEAMVAARAI